MLKGLKNAPWTGKVFGAFAGILSGGPVGLVLGTLLGHAFDRYSNATSSQHASQGRFRQDHLQSVFRLSGCLAKVDGRVSEEEIHTVEQLISQLGLSDTLRQSAIGHFAEGKQTAYPVQKMSQDTRLLASTLSYSDKEVVLAFLFQLAYADGRLSSEENQLLNQISSSLGIHKVRHVWLSQKMRIAQEREGFSERFQSAYQANSRSSNQGSNQRRKNRGKQNQRGRSPFVYGRNQKELLAAYRTIGLEQSATDDEIKRAYRRLMSKYHPDKLQAQGLSQQELDQAKEKVQRIQAAYNLIRDAR